MSKVKDLCSMKKQTEPQFIRRIENLIALEDKSWYIYKMNPVDYWDGWNNFYNKPLPQDIAPIIKDLEKVLPYCGWEGDIREGWFVSNKLIDLYGSCFAMKQNNNGTTFVITNFSFHEIKNLGMFSELIQEIEDTEIINLYCFSSGCLRDISHLVNELAYVHGEYEMCDPPSPAVPPIDQIDRTKNNIHLSKSFCNEKGCYDDKWGEHLKCPICGDGYVYFCKPVEIDSKDSYKASWMGRGNLIVIPFCCESNNHLWEICIGFHKGYSFSFIHIVEPLVKDKIYFIEAFGLDKIKIGFSRDPQKRLKELQTGSPVKLRLLVSMNGSQQQESMLHEKFAKLSIDGEWFHATKELRDYIDKIIIKG